MLSVQNKAVCEELFHNSCSKYILFCTTDNIYLQQDQQSGGKSLGISINRHQQFNSEVPKASALPALQTLTDRKELGARSLGVHKLSLQRFQLDGKTL